MNLIDENRPLKLAAWRADMELTQDDVAKRLGVSKQTIINWEKGRSTPNIAEIEMLAKIYRTTQEKIFLPCYSTNSRFIEKISAQKVES